MRSPTCPACAGAALSVLSPAVARQWGFRALRGSPRYLSRHYSSSKPTPTLSAQPMAADRLDQEAEKLPKIVDTGKEIAILGGGIAGLSAAYYAAKFMPNSKITVYESSNRFGGWLHTKKIEHGPNGMPIYLEKGPRTLRVAGRQFVATWALIEELGLADTETVYVQHKKVEARNRFIYYPDHIVRLPNGESWLQDITTVASEKLFNGFITGLLSEPLREAKQNRGDESVESFLKRRFGNAPAFENMVSAVMHGIYAGDIGKLSIQSIMPRLSLMEEEHDSIMMALYESFNRPKSATPFQQMLLKNEFNILLRLRSLGTFENLPNVQKNNSMIYFKEGLERLPRALVDRLSELPNVSLLKGTPISKVEYESQSSTIKVTPKNQPTKQYDAVISALPARKLSKIAADSSPLKTLDGVHSVSVMLVNVYYPNLEYKKYPGFGYLIPRTTPFSQNPEQALGVIFDSHANAELDGQDRTVGSKFTVMMGGHYWDGLDHFPDDEQGAEMAKQVLARHLGIQDEPELVDVALHRECIPQYNVGYRDLMARASYELKQSFRGQLTVAGSSFHGVSVPDCITSGFRAAVSVGANDLEGGLKEFESPIGFDTTVGYHWGNRK